ncbi:MAG: hypothetical protein A4E65_02808 [Syntrophorhabdus sp. PtaU1.Bin153]|nr:MAG: hypothetical protein A4E65_02808 [Syntrophorhabdus sp. PtaU1.Bin153]
MYLGMEPQAPFERSPGVIVLHAITLENPHDPIVHPDRKVDNDLSFCMLDFLENTGFNVGQIPGRNFDLFQCHLGKVHFSSVHHLGSPIDHILEGPNSLHAL